MKKLAFQLSAGMLVMLGVGGSAWAAVSKDTTECLACHADLMPGIVTQWESSPHWQAGVGCFECHVAQKGDADAMDHNGFLVATIVSPKDCGRCHAKESAEQEASHHAEAGNILNSNDGLLGQTLGGEPAVAVGCRQCHGSLVKTKADGSLDPSTWPNTGIGRVNPDGSKGTCSACHTRHRFSKEQARKPEVCGKCHLGPDHPQKEVYEESKHGILYRAYEDELNMDRPKWVPGEDYFDAPTCSTCHLGATSTQAVTHDVGARLSWDLRAAVSSRTKDSPQKLANMQDVCTSCHSKTFVDGFYKQLDDFVDLYNTKFAVPAKEIRAILMDKGVLTKANFDDKIDWIYWELWHHEGRRARHGAAMSGPDYAWWHGIYDVAKHFYTEMLPEAEEACKKAGKPEVYEEIIKKYIDGDPRHAWFTKGFDPKRLSEIKDYYKERYNQKMD
ncbi:MAG: cytochrome c3 family protein [Proteobacteria bacterium]|nr:cytochrome c3 family protein [Pseudomonadota bacterium]MBU1685813.1 cytochrome c3 family protein [Pseudomonadota bacterium]